MGLQSYKKSIKMVNMQLYANIQHQVADYTIEQQYRQNNQLNLDIIDDKIRTEIESSCKSCSFGELKLAIAPSGNIYPCERLIGNDTGELSMGNVYSGFDSSQKNSINTTHGTVCFFQKLFIEVADKVGSTLYEERNQMFMEKFYGKVKKYS